MKLPTQLGRKVLETPLSTVVKDERETVAAIAAFQRMACVADFDTSCRVLEVYLKAPFKKAVDKDLLALLRTVHSIVKQDVLGMAIDALVEIAQKSSGVAAKDRITAATILNELYGEKELIKDEKLSDRLVIGLVGDKR